jgi:hypothetical protein
VIGSATADIVGAALFCGLYPHPWPEDSPMTESTPPAPDTANGDAKKPKGFARVLGFFDSTAKVITTITALIVAIGGAWAAIHAFGGDGSNDNGGGSDTLTPAQHVAACKHTHDMTRDHQQVKVGVGQNGMATCEWPAPVYADADGYSVVDTTLGISIPDGSEATGIAYDKFAESGCQSYALTYSFKSQGDVQHIPPVTVAAGTVTNAASLGQPDQDAGVSVPTDPSEVDVVENDKEVFIDVRCNG